MAPGSGLFELGLGVVNGVGKLDATISHRVNESVSLFASTGIDTTREWQAMSGLRVRF